MAFIQRFTSTYPGSAVTPQYTLGHLDRLKEIEAALSRYGGLILTGAGYRGVGIPDCIRDGALAAERVVRYLSGERS